MQVVSTPTFNAFMNKICGRYIMCIHDYTAICNIQRYFSFLEKDAPVCKVIVSFPIEWVSVLQYNRKKIFYILQQYKTLKHSVTQRGISLNAGLTDPFIFMIKVKYFYMSIYLLNEKQAFW